MLFTESIKIEGKDHHSRQIRARNVGCEIFNSFIVKLRKKGTPMDGLESINKVLDYIEENLENRIDLSKAARLACCSEYHLSRLFSSLAGLSLSEYIRHRRLTLAAFEIQSSKTRILDVAVKYGYNSADSFARAFFKQHGIKPSAAREKGAVLKAYPRLSFQVLIKGEAGISYRVENVKKDMRVIGKAHSVNMRTAPDEILCLWNKMGTEGFLETLIRLGTGETAQHLTGLLGVYGEGAADSDGSFTYLIGVSSDKPLEQGLTDLTIPAGDWLVFTELQEARKRLFSEWIPTLGYKLDNRPFIENIYAPGHEPEMELWVPIFTKTDQRSEELSE